MNCEPFHLDLLGIHCVPCFLFLLFKSRVLLLLVPSRLWAENVQCECADLSEASAQSVCRDFAICDSLTPRCPEVMECYSSRNRRPSIELRSMEMPPYPNMVRPVTHSSIHSLIHPSIPPSIHPSTRTMLRDSRKKGTWPSKSVFAWIVRATQHWQYRASKNLLCFCSARPPWTWQSRVRDVGKTTAHVHASIQCSKAILWDGLHYTREWMYYRSQEHGTLRLTSNR